MGNKVICPLCEQEGYLVFEIRKKVTAQGKIGELIHRNVRRKEYEPKSRVRHPYAKIIHRVKKNGKWVNRSHYLGKITNIDSNLEKIQKTKGSKISDKVWQAFLESIEKARYSEFKNLSSPTNQVIAQIIALRKIPFVKFHDNIENQQDNPYHCPHCNEVIELVLNGYEISIKALDTRHSF